jgi:hypothetical protein
MSDVHSPVEVVHPTTRSFHDFDFSLTAQFRQEPLGGGTDTTISVDAAQSQMAGIKTPTTQSPDDLGTTVVVMLLDPGLVAIVLQEIIETFMASSTPTVLNEEDGCFLLSALNDLFCYIDDHVGVTCSIKV